MLIKVCNFMKTDTGWFLKQALVLEQPYGASRHYENCYYHKQSANCLITLHVLKYFIYPLLYKRGF